MANPKIIIRRSATPNKVPVENQLSLGELAINTYDGKLYLEQDQTSTGLGVTVISVNPWGVGVGSTAFDIYFTSGKVGVGLTNPSYNLEVSGNARVSGILSTTNLQIHGTVSAGNTFGSNGQYLKSTGVGVTWADFPSQVTTTRNVGIETATAGQSVFNFSYNVNYLDVFINGVKLTPSEYTATDGSTLTLSSPAFQNDIIEIITYDNLSFGAQGSQGVQGSTGVQGFQGVQGAQGTSFSRTEYSYIATAGQTTFAATYTDGTDIDVFLNGVRLNPADYTATSGTNVVLNTGAGVGNIIDIITFESAGPQGAQGVQGSVGAQGSQGIQGAQGPSLTVKEFTSRTGTANTTINNVSELRFNNGAGFNVEGDPLIEGSGVAFIDLGSTFNPWYVSGSTELKATGEEPIEIIAGPGIAITTKPVASVGIGTTFSKAITIAFSGTNSQWTTTNSGINTLSNVGIATTNPQTPLQVERYGVDTGLIAHTSRAGISSDIDSFNISSTNFLTAEYTIHVGYGTYIQSQKVLVMHDGEYAYSQEYGVMYQPSLIVSLGATMTGSTVKLQATPETGISGITTYRFTRQTII